MLILPIALKHAAVWCSHPELHRWLPETLVEQAGAVPEIRHAEDQGTYLTDLFQGGDKEVITYNGQSVEHVHRL